MIENELDLNYIKKKLQNILNREFKNYERKKIKDFPDRFNMCCCLCGDSEKSDSKKRLNLYFDNLRIKCFNCGESMSIVQFLDRFKEHIDLDQRIKIYNYVDTHTTFKNNNSDYILEELDKLIDVDTFVEYFNNKPNSWLYDIKPVEYNSHVYQYLKYERYVEDFSQIYQGVYRIIKNGKTAFETRVMINMNMLLSEKKLIGIQLRNLERDKSKRFFKIVDFEELYNYMNPNNHIDEITAIPYNKVSHFFNILNINFEDTITIFEGYLDSTFIPNSIGLIGTNSMDDAMNFLLNSEENLDLRFFLDNDIAGINKANKLLKKGFNVFLWNKLFEKLYLNNKNKSKAREIYEQIIDLNDLIILSKNPNINNKLKLDTFYSIDEFDTYYLNKTVYNKETKVWTKKKF